MSMRENYEAYQERRKNLAASPMGKMWTDQERRYVKPFRIFGNIYYVGDNYVCIHLIDTGEGLLLVDSGNCGRGATAMMIQAIWEAGFNPADVKWMILSHGHVDHIGGANFMKNMFGTKLYLGEPDAVMFREHPEWSYVQDSTDYMDGIFEPDQVIRDGDELRFGSVSLKFYLVPGHTAGCIAFFFDAIEDNEVKRVGYFGGFGYNTLQQSYLEEIGDTKHLMRKAYLDSIDKVRNEKVDIFLGNHPINNHTLEKMACMQEHPEKNPFISPGEWAAYLDEKKEGLLAIMRRENDPLLEEIEKK